MLINSSRFGDINVEQKDIITIKQGLIGFEKETSFILIPSKNPLTAWLQSTHTPSLAFVVSNPYDFYTDYEFTVENKDQEELSIQKPEDVTVLSILVVKAKEITANLLAPVIINKNTHCGKQIILNNSSYSAKHFVLTEIKQAAKNNTNKKLELTVQR